MSPPYKEAKLRGITVGKLQRNPRKHHSSLPIRQEVGGPPSEGTVGPADPFLIIAHCPQRGDGRQK